MSQSDRLHVSDKFHISARGPQSWEWADVEIVNGRATLVVDGDEDRAITLTRIQTEGLCDWIRFKLEAAKT